MRSESKLPSICQKRNLRAGEGTKKSPEHGGKGEQHKKDRSSNGDRKEGDKKRQKKDGAKAHRKGQNLDGTYRFNPRR